MEKEEQENIEMKENLVEEVKQREEEEPIEEFTTWS